MDKFLANTLCALMVLLLVAWVAMVVLLWDKTSTPALIIEGVATAVIVAMCVITWSERKGGGR